MNSPSSHYPRLSRSRFPVNPRLFWLALLTAQLVAGGALRALSAAAVWCRGRAVGRGFGGVRWANPSESPSRFVVSSKTAAMGALCVFTKGKGPQGVWPPPELKIVQLKMKGVTTLMLRRNWIGILVLALATTVAYGAQVKEMPKTPAKPINPPPSIVDINTAPEGEIVSVGIDRAVAKKIIEGRPWRNKRDLLTKQLLTKEQYEKLKDALVAKQPKKS